MFDNVSEAPPWPEVWVEPAPPPPWEQSWWADLDAAADREALRAMLDRGATGPELWDLLGRLTDGSADCGTSAPEDAARLDQVRAWARVVAHGQAQLMAQIAALHDTRDPGPSDAEDDDADDELAYAEFVPVEIGLALRLGPVASQLLVDSAVRIVNDLPATHAALAAGRIDQATAKAICEETERLSDEHRAVVESQALAKAATTGGTARAVRLFTRRQADRVDAAAARQRCAEARERIGVHQGRVEDGVAQLDVLLSVVDRAAVLTTLNAHADLARALPGETRTRAQLRAAVLVDLVTRPWLYPALTDGTAAGDPADEHGTCGAVLGADPTHDRHGQPIPTTSNTTGRWKVDVVVNLTTLLGADDDPADLVGHGMIDADTARLLAADATWRRLVTDPLTGAVLERSTHRYRPPRSMIEGIEARDQHCATPGCRRPAHDCDLDHRIPHSRGGPTCQQNLWPLCRYHHRCKHSPGWRFERHHDRSVTVTTPTGHTYTADPPSPWD